jgi:hypothetical protein
MLLLCIAVVLLIAYLLYGKKETYNSGASQRRNVFVDVPITTFEDEYDKKITRFEYAR